jgi:E1A/CREB-binding protein
MKSRFEGECNETYPFKTKAIFAFEEIDGTDVVFFGMHVQEYGSECAAPNTRRVYISYLDSVFFFRPKELRTAVYHEILIGYLDYVKRMGFQWAHIWACPPSEGDDYIFHCHPAEQKVPKPKRLQDWYKKMLDKGVIERVVIDYKDIHKDAIENGMKTPLDIPYFEGDFWPNVLEECIKESEQEEEKRRKEEAEAQAQAQADDDYNGCGDGDGNGNGYYGDGGANANGSGGGGGANTGSGESQGGGGNNKNNNNSNKKNSSLNSQQQKKKNIKNKISQRKSSAKKMGSSSTDLMTKILSTMEKHKEVFFVIRLLEMKQVIQMGPIVDRDPVISCDLMNGRDEFLNFARDKHHEFSSLRRAKYSSMALLWELHTQNNEKFTYTCDKCRQSVESRYHCTVCADFDLCIQCFENKGGHEHKMTKLLAGQPNPGEEANHAKGSAAGGSSGDPSKQAKVTPSSSRLFFFSSSSTLIFDLISIYFNIKRRTTARVAALKNNKNPTWKCTWPRSCMPCIAAMPIVIMQRVCSLSASLPTRNNVKSTRIPNVTFVVNSWPCAYIMPSRARTINVKYRFVRP